MISVIVPVYNAPHLEDTMRSILSQTYRDIEVICVDDGSTDGSGRELARWAETDGRVRVLSQANGGLSVARNSGLDAAKGDWVAFVDAGDILREDALEVLHDAAVEAEADVSVSRSFAKASTVAGVMQRLNASARASGTTCHQKPIEDILRYRYAFSSVCNKLYRRAAIGDLRFQKGICFEDWPFVIKLFGMIRRFVLVKDPLYGYVMSAGSITRSGFSVAKVKGYVAGIESVNGFYASQGAVPRAVLRRCGIAAKMMLNKVWHSRASLPELQSLALAEFWRLVRERKVLLRDVALKSALRAFAMYRPALTIWIAATLFWLSATALFTMCYPVWMPDVVVRYGPMADAFAAGDWEMAFHPRFGVLFQVLTGIVRKVTAFDGLQSCQCVAAAFWSYSIIPLWAVSKKVFGHRTALLCAAFLLIAPRPFGLALDGLRDDGRLLAMLLCAYGFIDRRSIWLATGAFILLTLRIDSYLIGTVLVGIWILREIAKREWRTLLLPIMSWMAGTAAVVTMVHHYTGHWVPAIQYIKYLGRWL